MKKYFSNYTAYILEMMDSNDADLEELEKELLIKIGFMQHERFIHLIVTCLFAVLLFMSLIIFFVSQMAAMLLVCLLMLCLVIPYIAHYFFLENGVQRLYSIYDSLHEKIKNNK